MDFEFKNLLMAYEYMLSGLLSLMETKRRYINSECTINVSEKLADATLKLHQALADIEQARKL